VSVVNESLILCLD